MELIGLFLFSVSVAFLGVFHTVPLTNIRPDADFALRLQSGFRMGYVLDRIGEVVDAVVPRHRLMEPIATPTPEYIYTSISTHAAYPTCSVRPVTLASSQPASTLATSVIASFSSSGPNEKLSATAVSHPLPLARAINSAAETIEATVLDWVRDVWSFVTRAVKWITLSSLDVQWHFKVTVFVFLGCTLVAITGTTVIVLLTVYSVCRQVGREFIRKAVADSNEVASMMEEIGQQKGMLLEKMDSFHKKVSESINHIERRVSEKESNIDVMLDYTKRRADQVTDSILDAVAKLERRYLPFPTKEDLLGDRLTMFHDTLNAAQKDLLAQVEGVKLDVLAKAYELKSGLSTQANDMRSHLRVQADEVKALVPEFKKELLKTTLELRGSHLGDWVELFEAEKARLKKMVAKIQTVAKGFPTQATADELIHTLKGEYHEFERKVAAAREDVHKAGQETENIVFQLPRLEQNVQQMEDDLQRLDEELALARVAIKSARSSLNEVGTLEEICSEGGSDLESPGELSELDKEILREACDSDTGVDGNNNLADSEGRGRQRTREEITWPSRYYPGSPSVPRGRRTRRWWACTSYTPEFGPTPPRSCVALE
ncbi:hypothetical protein D8B26_001416 [Coccidioides posadasii str. Silveira]|uniref:Uncharacterized protein n=3 Tax=Coccidioides posadasii TaxID=199306 RepID=E9DAG5_COCPS|nr:hypothetical protein CPC735_046920 [Coccidioides posadasii C735 delta SOWgp]EER23322.1 hypothetical protein CPC735_046920 [Coccidioides posadasii C735 delta SOWgp]EFW16587.1 conserved hypothetical protein [Coccidioides posadasii str. Silveira]KMM64649.1 hypothetical protein CPAG_01001 [Coccidioides posadasii RMSCC 3488]QVM06710.1 hypothetical protein D8B26_001416 [Coccidioides posadasii str. Silveira]|eukprot:XP_003065467.1 hypothetical protein CPC735_046920 [Coccidioides posadasii C735 delta SOWgp]